jgi:SNF2 family DNA or RNA helicase
MDRNTASKFCHAELDKYNLTEWHVRITQDSNMSFLGLCDHQTKCIIINAFHTDIHPDVEVRNTIRHEIAHAIVGPGQGHNNLWAQKAQEIGCDNTFPCSHLYLPKNVLDAIRSGATIEMTVEEQVIRTPSYKVTRLQEKCPDCGKVAKEKFSIDVTDKEGNQVKLITLECFHIIKRIIPKATPFESMVSNDWKPEVKNCKHEWDKNHCNKCNEYKLFNFQTIGARSAEVALAIQKGFGFFDDMGLGKTVEALAIIKFHAKQYTPCMIVTKSAIKFQWFKQAIRWLGPEYLAQIISTSKDYLFPNLKLYIIPYDLLRRFPREKLDKLGIKLVILDECQQIKNPDSTRTQEVRKLVNSNGCKVLPLSGTPWKNRGGEFFPVLNMMDPIKFYSYQHYLDNWVDYYYEGNKKKMGGIRRPEKFREFTSSMLIRREYEEVMDEFPEINRMKLNVQLDDLAQSTYEDSVSEFVAWYNEVLEEGGEEKLNGLAILAKMSRMRHISGLAKIPATLGFVEEFVDDTDKKLVVFVHHKDVGELMYSALQNTDKVTNPDNYSLAQTLVDENIKVFKYTSELSGGERFTMQEEFNKLPRAIMIASTLACGEGVDLQTCADVVMHERQWNPQNEDQAAPGRFRRIGQLAKKISITFPEAEGTIDEHLDSINERKRLQYHAVMNKSEVPAWSQDSMAKELADIIIAKHKERHSKDVKTIKAPAVISKGLFL